MPLRFGWDVRKDAENIRKHGVSFAEATTAFGDPLSVTVADPDHSADEERFILIGRSDRQHLVVVAHVERGDTIRIRSRRLAGRALTIAYEEDQ